MIINKWNDKKHIYEKTQIPDDWNVKTYCDDMNEVVSCVCCGKKIIFGNGYTSRRFHTEIGMGYCECEKCYFSYKG